jgi:hypothetical protein
MLRRHFMGNLAREWEPELDLSSLACDSAMELDNLIRGKSQGLDTVKKLIEIISDVGQGLTDSVTHGGLAKLSPTTAVALNSAIDESKLSPAQIDISGLSKETDKIIGSLKNLVANTQTAKYEEPVEKLRSFCIALSRHALATKPPVYEGDSGHPYRR